MLFLLVTQNCIHLFHYQIFYPVLEQTFVSHNPASILSTAFHVLSFLTVITQSKSITANYKNNMKQTVIWATHQVIAASLSRLPKRALTHLKSITHRVVTNLELKKYFPPSFSARFRGKRQEQFRLRFKFTEFLFLRCKFLLQHLIFTLKLIS